MDRALCGCIVNSLVHFFADFTPYLKSIFVIFTLRYSFRPLDYCRIHCLTTFSNVALNLDNFSSLMVGVTYLNCDLQSLHAKAAKLDKRVRELIDDPHIQLCRQPRGCRAGRLARRDAKPRIRQLGIPRRDSGDKPTSRHVYVRPVGNGA